MQDKPRSLQIIVHDLSEILTKTLFCVLPQRQNIFVYPVQLALFPMEKNTHTHMKFQCIKVAVGYNELMLVCIIIINCFGREVPNGTTNSICMEYLTYEYFLHLITAIFLILQYLLSRYVFISTVKCLASVTKVVIFTFRIQTSAFEISVIHEAINQTCWMTEYQWNSWLLSTEVWTCVEHCLLCV